MSSLPAQDTLSVLVKSELQWDYDAQQSAFPTGSLSAIAVTSANTGQPRHSVYYIHGGAVMNAYQPSHAAVTSGKTEWSVEDMHLPSDTGNPTLIRAISIAEANLDKVVVVTRDGSSFRAFIIEVGMRYPQWVEFSLPSGSVVDFQLFFDAALTLNFAASVGAVVFYAPADPVAISIDGWIKDLGLQNLTVTSFAPNACLGKPANKTVFGYTVASKQGLKFVTGGSGTLKNPAVQTSIDAGSYSAVYTANIPGYANSLPMVFAIDATLKAYYFQPQLDGTFKRVPIFAGLPVQSLQTVVRSTVRDGNASPDLWAEIFAMEASGNVYHLETSFNEDTGEDGFVVLSNGNATVQSWRTNYARLLTNAKAIVSDRAEDGDAFLLSYTQVGNSNDLTFSIQDPETTDWIQEQVALPATQPHAATQESRSYYIEASIVDGNNTAMPGRAVVVSSTQYTTLNVNGSLVSVDPSRSLSVVSNGSGRVCFTVDAAEGLGVPTFTLWVEGMALDTVIDVQPNGEIQATFAGLDVAALRAATNNDAPGDPQLFPADKFTDDQLREAAGLVKDVITVVDPGFSARNVSLQDVDHSHPSRRYLHRRTRPTLAVARKRHERHLGRVRRAAHHPSHGVYMELRPHLRSKRVTAAEAAVLRDQMKDGFSLLDLSWGDVWNGISDGLYTVKKVLLDPLVDGFKATIQFLGLDAVWEGITDFVQKAYNVIGSIFDALAAGFDKLFGWLAFLFDWTSFGRTANQLQTILNAAPAWGKDVFGNILPKLTQDKFGSLKGWLDNNFETAKAALVGPLALVGTFDDARPTQGASRASAGDSLLDDLPSSATWLLNKILNGGGDGGDPAPFIFSSSLTRLESLFGTFSANVEGVGLNDDFQKAYQSITDLFGTIADRGIFDSTSWAAVLDAVKGVLYILIDLAEVTVLTFESVVAEAMAFLMDILNTPLNLPVISSIFKKLTGVELTITNTICYILAVPLTLMVKLLTGAEPDITGQATLSADASSIPRDDQLVISRGCLFVLNGMFLAMGDLLSAWEDPLLKTLRTGASIVIPIAILGVGGYPVYDSFTPQSFALDVMSGIPGFLNLAYLVLFKEPAAEDKLGQVGFLIIGVGQLFMTIWDTVKHFGNTSPKIIAKLAAEWFIPLVNLTRLLKTAMKKVQHPIAKAVLLFIILAIDVFGSGGTGSGLIISGLTDNNLDHIQSDEIRGLVERFGQSVEQHFADKANVKAVEGGHGPWGVL